MLRLLRGTRHGIRTTIPRHRLAPALAAISYIEMKNSDAIAMGPDAETLLTAFLETVPDAVYFKDLSSRFIAVSKSKASRHGLADGRPLIGKTDADFFSAAHAARALSEEQEIIRTGESMLGLLHKFVWADGREGWGLTSKLPLRNARGEIVGTFGVTRDVTESKRLEAELERTQRDLIDTSRLAGMAEVATGVLHNVGNVLTSLNVSAELITAKTKQSKLDALPKVTALLREHLDHLSDYLKNDAKGKLVLDYLDSLALHSTNEREAFRTELHSMQQNIAHIKEIVAMQQSYATLVAFTEQVSLPDLFEDALRINAAALVRHEVRIVRDFQPTPPIFSEKGKILQVLINLIRNAKYACDEDPKPEGKTLTLSTACAGDHVRLIVTDNGVGIVAENLARIFQHGFTTRSHGHGFGLHSSAIAAQELGGSLLVHSGGARQGATFTLELPTTPPEKRGTKTAKASNPTEPSPEEAYEVRYTLD
jgi:PAS domain S-box-containing protein